MTNDQINTFLQGGKATFTLESMTTGKHYTFKATKADNPSRNGEVVVFIAMLTGSDNSNDFSYLGTMFVQHGNLTYRMTQKSPNNKTAHAALGFFASLLNRDKDLEEHNLIFRHAGTCGVCGRKLTTPESIDSGIGPVCAAK